MEQKEKKERLQEENGEKNIKEKENRWKCM